MSRKVRHFWCSSKTAQKVHKWFLSTAYHYSFVPRLILPPSIWHFQYSNTVVRTDWMRIGNSCVFLHHVSIFCLPDATRHYHMKRNPPSFSQVYLECTNKVIRKCCLIQSLFHNCVTYLYCGIDNTCMITEISVVYSFYRLFPNGSMEHECYWCYLPI